MEPGSGHPPPVFKTAAPLFFMACDYSGILPPTPPRGFEFRDFSRAIGRRSIECDPAEIQPRPRGSSAAGPAAGTPRARVARLFCLDPPPVASPSEKHPLTGRRGFALCFPRRVGKTSRRRCPAARIVCRKGGGVFLARVGRVSLGRFPLPLYAPPKIKLIFSARAVPAFAPAQLAQVVKKI